MIAEPLILARGLTKVYDMGETQVHALRGVDFRVDRGEFVAIIGQSGSGKSTLMHILGCLDTPTDGQIFIAGEDVSRYSESDLAEIRNSTIGFVFQTFNLLPRFNLARNTQLPMTYAGVSGRDRKRRSSALLERVGLGDRLDHRPNQLSGGQCQRAAIARALVTNPEIILADEPTGNLDSASGEMILDLLKELHREGHTIILVTHEDRIAEAAHRQIRILDGRIVEDTGCRVVPHRETIMTNESEAEVTPEPSKSPPNEMPSPRRKRRKRRWLRWLIALLIFGGIGFGIKSAFFKTPEDPFLSLKKAIKIEEGEIEERLLETGTVELRTTIEVKSKMGGKVKELLVEEGDAIQKGDVLAVIEPDPNEILRLYQKRAAVNARRLELAEKRRDLTRSIELHDRGVMPDDQFEKVRDAATSSEMNFQVALLELQALEQEIDPAVDAIVEPVSPGPEGSALPGGDEQENTDLSRLTDIRVVSPRSGIVIERPVEVGELVISGTATTIAGTTIIKLGDPAEAIVKASVNEVDIGKIKPGQLVEITLSAYEEESFPAKVHRIAPLGLKAQGQNIVSFAVELRFEQLDPRILPGMTCDLDIVIARKEQVSRLPFSAIFQEREKEPDDVEDKELDKAGTSSRRQQVQVSVDDITYLDYVWVKKGEDWDKQQVKLGLKGTKQVEILEGPAVGTEVYPDAERLSWMIKERDRQAKKKGWFGFGSESSETEIEEEDD